MIAITARVFRVAFRIAAARRQTCSRLLLLALFFTGCQHRPPRESGQFREAELVDIAKLDPTIRLDIRYATTNNFMHRPMYAHPRAFLQRPAAEALVRAHQALNAKGYGIVIFDGYRPWAVTKAFWDAASEEQRRIEFVANPKNGSRHNRGCAADISLFDLATGKEAEMPSAYDEFSERAFPTYAGGTPKARALRDLLRATMEAEGFTVYPAEWWHFDYKDWKQYRILNLPFENIRESERPSTRATIRRATAGKNLMTSFSYSRPFFLPDARQLGKPRPESEILIRAVQ